MAEGGLAGTTGTTGNLTKIENRDDVEQVGGQLVHRLCPRPKIKCVHPFAIEAKPIVRCMASSVSVGSGKKGVTRVSRQITPRKI